MNFIGFRSSRFRGFGFSFGCGADHLQRFEIARPQHRTSSESISYCSATARVHQFSFEPHAAGIKHVAQRAAGFKHRLRTGERLFAAGMF